MVDQGVVNIEEDHGVKAGMVSRILPIGVVPPGLGFAAKLSQR